MGKQIQPSHNSISKQQAHIAVSQDRMAEDDKKSFSTPDRFWLEPKFDAVLILSRNILLFRAAVHITLYIYEILCCKSDQQHQKHQKWPSTSKKKH